MDTIRNQLLSGAVTLSLVLVCAAAARAGDADSDLLRAALTLRQKTYSAAQAVKKADDKLMQSLYAVPTAEGVLVDIHIALSGISPDSSRYYGGLGPELFAARQKLEQGIQDLAQAPKNCEAGSLSRWQLAVAGRRSVEDAVGMASRARMRVSQLSGLEAKLSPIVFELRKKTRWSADASKLDRLRLDIKGALESAAKYLDAGLNNEALHDIDIGRSAQCPDFAMPQIEESLTSSSPAVPFGQTASPRAAQALAWSAEQMPGGKGTGVNRNNGQSTAKSQNAWNSWCLAFVATAYGRDVEELRAPSAISSYKKFVRAGKLVNSRSGIPAGAPVFFKATRGNNYWGHIAIFTGRYTESGEPIIRTTGWGSWPGIHEITLAEMERKGGTTYTGFGVVTP